MNIYFLKYFYDAIRFRSISEAANENHVTKSAVSQGISQLEKMLKVPLLTHQRNRIKTTPQGDLLFSSCKGIFNTLDELKLSLQSSLNDYEGSLNFAFSHSLGLSIIPIILPIYRKIAPKVNLQILFGHTGNIKQWLEAGKIDFGLVLDNDDLSAFILEPLYHGNFAFYESIERNHAEALTSSLFSPARVEVFKAKKAFHKKFGYELKTEMEICSWEAIANLISINLGVGLLPDYIHLNQSKSNLLRLCKMNVAIPYTLHIASAEPLSKNAHLFADLLKKHFKSSQLSH